MPELGRSLDFPTLPPQPDQEQRREARKAIPRVLSSWGSGDLSFFMPEFPLLEPCLSHRSRKSLRSDLVRQALIKACMRQCWKLKEEDNPRERGQRVQMDGPC